MKVDLRKFAPAFTGISTLRGTLRNEILSKRLAAISKVYLVREMDKAIKDNGNLAEGQTRMVRGSAWRGWSLKAVKKYGSTVYQSTRYYFRKFARSAENLKKKQGATFTKGQRNAKWGKGDQVIETGDKPRNFGQEFHVRSRPFEKVWTKRAGGSRHSSSSKLLADLGGLRNSIIAMETRINLGANPSIEFRPGKPVKYFDRQNKMRRIWTWFLPQDADKIAGLLQVACDQAVSKI